MVCLLIAPVVVTLSAYKGGAHLTLMVPQACTAMIHACITLACVGTSYGYQKKKKEENKKKMHWPGIEPGPPAWQARILPLNHQCLLDNNLLRLKYRWGGSKADQRVCSTHLDRKCSCHLFVLCVLIGATCPAGGCSQSEKSMRWKSVWKIHEVKASPRNSDLSWEVDHSVKCSSTIVIFHLPCK